MVLHVVVVVVAIVNVFLFQIEFTCYQNTGLYVFISNKRHNCFVILVLFSRSSQKCRFSALDSGSSSPGSSPGPGT